MELLEAIRGRPELYLGPMPLVGLCSLAIEALRRTGPRRVLRLQRQGAELSFETDGVLSPELALPALRAGVAPRLDQLPFLVLAAFSRRLALEVGSDRGGWSWSSQAGRTAAPAAAGTRLRLTLDEAVLPGARAAPLVSLAEQLGDVGLSSPGVLVELVDGEGVRVAWRLPRGPLDWLLAQGVGPLRTVEVAWPGARARVGFGLTEEPGCRTLALVNGLRVVSADASAALAWAVARCWPPDQRRAPETPARRRPGWAGVVVVDLTEGPGPGNRLEALELPGLPGALSAALG